MDTSLPEAAALPAFAGRAWLVGAGPADKPLVSGLIATGTPPGQMVLVAMRVTIGGGRSGVIAYGLTPNALLRTLLRNPVELRGVLAVLDRDDVVVMRSRAPEKFVGQHVTTNLQADPDRQTRGVRDSRTLEGYPTIAAFNTSPGTGWMTVVAAYKSELLRPAFRLLTIALAVAAVVGVVVLGLAWWVSRDTAQVAALIHAETQKLAHGGEVAVRRTGIMEADSVLRALAATGRELAERQAAVTRARDEAMAASRAKDEFLAALSHELRTPLNPVLLLASESANDPGYPPEVRQVFGMIEKNILHESRLIDDLLDVTRISAGKLSLQLEPLGVDSLVTDALELLRSKVAEKQLHLHADLAATGVRVQGDATRLRQVFTNVIGNAVKFTPPGGSIAVTSRSDAAGQAVVVEVSDSGVGLTPEEIGRVFERFAQGDHAHQGRQSPFGGLGLGLAISKSLVEMHGGRIEASSAGRGRGAIFRVRLPRLAEAPAAQGATGGAS